jgi:stress-induced morphogen
MYQVYVESVDFKGLSMVKQHQLVNKVSVIKRRSFEKNAEMHI